MHTVQRDTINPTQCRYAKEARKDKEHERENRDRAVGVLDFRSGGLFRARDPDRLLRQSRIEDERDREEPHRVAR